MDFAGISVDLQLRVIPASAESTYRHPDNALCRGGRTAAQPARRECACHIAGADDVACTCGCRPKDAVIPVSGGHVLFVAEEGVAVQRRIRLGGAAGDKFVVLDGVKAGEQVITRGNEEGLVDGKKIKMGDPGKRADGPKGEKWTLNWNARRGPASVNC